MNIKHWLNAYRTCTPIDLFNTYVYVCMFGWLRIYLASPKNEFHELHLGNHIWFMVSAICLLASVAAAAVASLLSAPPPAPPCWPSVCLPTVYWYFMRHFALQIALIAILGTFIAPDICITRIAIANLIVAQPTTTDCHKNRFPFLCQPCTNTKWNYTIQNIYFLIFILPLFRLLYSV